MPQLAAWEKVFLEDASFMESTHGKVGCVICHGGDSSAQGKDDAHVGLVADPSDVSCSTCHKDISCMNEDSLHTTLSGMKYALETRGGDLTDGSTLDTAFDNHCSKCHTSCGQCHISIPDDAGGGFVYSHEFLGTPDMTSNCTACHGSRVGNEYLGLNEGVDADVHYEEYGMKCSSCHGDELHGSTEAVDTRYDNATVSCVDAGCHDSVLTDSINMHKKHVANHIEYDSNVAPSLSCQVCHSVTYKNCYNCHVALDDNELPYYQTDESVMDFMIGLNPLQSNDRPYDYVVLRHAPVSTSTFSGYGTNLLPDFDALSTWKYATPHNIQKSTPQNATCNSCHGHAELFLTTGNVADDEETANASVIVNVIPPTL